RLAPAARACQYCMALELRSVDERKAIERAQPKAHIELRERIALLSLYFVTRELDELLRGEPKAHRNPPRTRLHTGANGTGGCGRAEGTIATSILFLAP